MPSNNAVLETKLAKSQNRGMSDTFKVDPPPAVARRQQIAGMGVPMGGKQQVVLHPLLNLPDDVAYPGILNRYRAQLFNRSITPGPTALMRML
ncbi:MAG: hypothetical protein M0Z36_02475 [Thermaerobacter sp.]|nr:hypothetical protein [Thermaerobacter sp.]